MYPFFIEPEARCISFFQETAGTIYCPTAQAASAHWIQEEIS